METEMCFFFWGTELQMCDAAVTINLMHVFPNFILFDHGPANTEVCKNLTK